MEDNCRVYEGEDAFFLRITTSFVKSVRYEVLSFACLTVTKNELGTGQIATLLSC